MSGTLGFICYYRLMRSECLCVCRQDLQGHGLLWGTHSQYSLVRISLKECLLVLLPAVVGCSMLTSPSMFGPGHDLLRTTLCPSILTSNL